MTSTLASQKTIADPDKSRLKSQSSASNRLRTTTQRRRATVNVRGGKMKAKQKQQANANESTSSLLISNKYQPRKFEEIVGQNIVVKTLSNAVNKKKIAPLYLFHGPNGTGKTSTARVFSMALNCESTYDNNTKPCCNCKGCSRSLYMMELCSGSGFEKIKTLLNNTSLAQTVSGFKVVLIIEECHLLTLEAWDEVMSLSDASNLVFVLITHVDVSAITANISSRCHKFYFKKLNDDDIAERLSRIIASEGMVIENEALKLIVYKSQGSLRDAENILDQLALLGPTINTSAAKQLVGLIPQSELLDLLAMAVSGDTVNTIRNAKKLMNECAVEPASFVSQLTNLITELLSGDLSSSPHTNLLSKTRLCYILKLLVDTESSSTTNIIEAFLDITSVNASSMPHSSSSFGEITPTHDSDAKRGSLSDMEQLWKDVLKGIQSSHTQKFLHHQAKLALLSITNTNAFVHLTFTRRQDKMAAEVSQQSLAKALGVAIGCPVTLHMSLDEPSTFEADAKTKIDTWYSQRHNTNKNINGESSHGLRLTKSKSCSTSQPNYSTKGKEARNPTSDTKDQQTTNLTQAVDRQPPLRHRWLSLSSIQQSDASVEPYSQDIIYANLIQAGADSKHAATQSNKQPPRHRRRPSLSSIPQNDASVEPYSQDVTYANVNNDILRNKGFSKSSRSRESADQLRSNPTWCC
ncbi:putative DNA-directed DNA polymerase [Helianthus annuus]|nr:putative DNA-directed DNA polymerase [Helianthus annuus]KAJ0658354.1 putative DNA-directed DNA polymerase [Helianthus annuus]